jgi:hypothetical protein
MEMLFGAFIMTGTFWLSIVAAFLIAAPCIV